MTATPSRSRPTKRLLRALSFPLVLLAACILWFEEWLWEPLGALMQRIGQWPLLHRLERLISLAPPWLALCLFIVPALVLLPFKLVGLWLIAHHHGALGIGVFLAAKVVGTALGARLLVLVKPALMQLPWFPTLWNGFIRGRDWIYERVRSQAIWRWTRLSLHKLKNRRSELMQRLKLRWQAIQRRMRQREK